MIIRTLVQLKGEKEPHQHYALVFDDAMGPQDLIAYRNAATSAVKAIISSSDNCFMEQECFFLLQLAEYISSSLDDEMDSLERMLKEKGGSV